MRVIKFQPQHYTANVALLINVDKQHDSRPMLLTPSGEVSAHTDQWQTYLSAVNFSRNDILQEYAGKWYDIFTVDMLGYKDLYVQVIRGGLIAKTIRVFEDWSEIVSKVQSLDMSMTSDMQTDAITVSALSGSNVVQAKLSRRTNARMYFANAHLALTRLLNIAFDRNANYDSLRFMFVSNNGNNVNVLIQPETVYDTTDYSIVTKPIGQQFTLSKAVDNFELSCTMFGETSVLCRSFAELERYREFVDILEVGDNYVLQFAYDSNRDYRIVADVAVVSEEAIPINSLVVHSQDMLRHAMLLGNILKRNKYIVSLEKHLQYTLVSVYNTIKLMQLPMYRWPLLSNNLAYERFVYYEDLYFNDFDRLSDFYFAKIAVQSGVTEPKPDYAIYSMPDDAHGNNALLHSDTDFAENFKDYDLPIIQGNKVFYYNLQIQFDTIAYSGKPFAMTFVKDESMHEGDIKYSIDITNDLVRIICTANRSNYTIRKFAYGVTSLSQVLTFTVMPSEHTADFFVLQDTSN